MIYVFLKVIIILTVLLSLFNLSIIVGLILRLFMYLYDNEITCEEVFLKWKEELKNPLPGKQKTLFQVNTWLTWLEEDEESDIDEDQD